MSKSTSRKIPSKNLKTLTKVDLVSNIEEKTSMDSGQAFSITEAILEVVREALESKTSVLLARVGTLTVSYKNSRPGRNPKTLEDSIVSSRYAVTLRSGKRSDSERINQPQIIERISKKLPNVSKSNIKAALNEFLLMIGKVKKGTYRVEIRNLGVFYPSVFPGGRKARNPKTGETVEAKEKVVVRYTCPKAIKEILNAE